MLVRCLHILPVTEKIKYWLSGDTRLLFMLTVVEIFYGTCTCQDVHMSGNLVCDLYLLHNDYILVGA